MLNQTVGWILSSIALPTYTERSYYRCHSYTLYDHARPLKRSYEISRRHFVAKKGLEPIFLGYEPNELPFTRLCQSLFFFFEKIKLDYTLKIRYLLFTIEFKITQLSQRNFWFYQKIKTPKKREKTLLTTTKQKNVLIILRDQTAGLNVPYIPTTHIRSLFNRDTPHTERCAQSNRDPLVIQD